MKLFEIRQLKVFIAKTPSISEGKRIIHVRHASKSPRINHVYLNRALPTLPDRRESKISILGLDSASLRSDQNGLNSGTGNV
jgi:hypothetical protein